MAGCWSVPCGEDTLGESEREGASEKRRAAGTEPVGVMSTRFEAKTALLGALPVKGGIVNNDGVERKVEVEDAIKVAFEGLVLDSRDGDYGC